MPDTVLYELSGHVATITLNRPKALNAINGELRQDLNSAWNRFRGDDEAWVAIITGAGRAFCAGADMRDGEGSVGVFEGTFWEKPTINSFESGLELFKPTIAAVNGHCLGYGSPGHWPATSSSPATRPPSASPKCASACPPSWGHPIAPAGGVGRCHGVAADRRAGQR